MFPQQFNSQQGPSLFQQAFLADLISNSQNAKNEKVMADSYVEDKEVERTDKRLDQLAKLGKLKSDNPAFDKETMANLAEAEKRIAARIAAG